MSGPYCRLVLAACLLFAAAAAPSEPPPVKDAVKPLPTTDRQGEPLPPGARARLGTVRFRYPGQVSAIRYSRDGKILAVIGAASSLCVWDATTGKELPRFDDLQAREYSSLAFAPDGKTLALAERNGAHKIYLCDVATGKERRSFAAPEAVSVISFSPDGKRLALANGSHRVTLWDVASGKEVGQFRGTEQQPAPEPSGLLRLVQQLLQSPLVLRFCQEYLHLNLNINPINRQVRGFSAYSLAFSPDGTTLAAAGQEGERSRGMIYLWDLAAGKARQLDIPTASSVHDLAFTPDGKTLAASCADAKVRLWDTATWKEPELLDGSTGHLAEVTVSADGKWLAVGNYGGPFSVWNLATRQRVGPFEEQAYPAGLLAFTRDSRTLATADQYGVIRRWEVPAAKEVQPQPGHHSNLGAVAFAPDGRWLATGGWDQTIRLWDATTGEELGTFEQPAPALKGDVSRPLLAFSPDGKLLAGGTGVDVGGGWIRLWDVAGRKAIGLLKGPEGPVAALIFAPHGRTLFTGHADGTARCWNVATGRELRKFVLHDRPGAPGGFQLRQAPLAVALSPDGRTLAVGGSADWTGLMAGEKYVIRFWELAAGTERGRLDVKWDWDNGGLDQLRGFGGLGGLRYGGTPMQLAFSPDGKGLAVAAGSRIRLWELPGGRELRQFGVQGGTVDTVAFSPDGRHLLASNDMGTIRFWETATGTLLHQIYAHQSGATAIALARDGRSVASAGNDTAALIWDLPAVLEMGRAPAAAVLSRERLAGLWAGLGQADAAKALEALVALAATPEQTVPFLRERLRPVAAVEPQRVERLLADLDSERFEARQKATDELEDLAELAGPALQRLLQTRPTLEVRQRAERLIQKLEGPVTSPERLRALRAVELLERIGSREAREVLQTLARGTPAARLTQEARDSLERLARPVSRP